MTEETTEPVVEQTEEVSPAETPVEEVKQDNVMTSFTNESGVNITRRDLNPDELIIKKLQLEQAKITLDKTNLELKELERQLDMKLPSRWLDDDIAKLEKDIAAKSKDGKELTEADLDFMNSQLIGLKASKELDIPTRELRLKIQGTMASLNSPESPSRMIKVLEKQIRERSENFVSLQQKQAPLGVA
jgi:hypothetical protein